MCHSLFLCFVSWVMLKITQCCSEGKKKNSSGLQTNNSSTCTYTHSPSAEWKFSELDKVQLLMRFASALYVSVTGGTGPKLDLGSPVAGPLC